MMAPAIAPTAPPISAPSPASWVTPPIIAPDAAPTPVPISAPRPALVMRPSAVQPAVVRAVIARITRALRALSILDSFPLLAAVRGHERTDQEQDHSAGDEAVG